MLPHACVPKPLPLQRVTPPSLTPSPSKPSKPLPRYACTILTAARKGFWLTSASGAKPTLTIVNTSNVAVVNVSIAYNFADAQGCSHSDPEGGGATYVCPGLLVYRSFGVQVAQVGRLNTLLGYQATPCRQSPFPCGTGKFAAM